ncbi:MAG: hypothetical protein ACXW2P_10750 [Thermoanaerobaculia bacterium]
MISLVETNTPDPEQHANTSELRALLERTMLKDKLVRRAGVTLASAFSFGNARCDRVVANVTDQLSTKVVT